MRVYYSRRMNKYSILAASVLCAACATGTSRYDPALDLANAERAFARAAQSRTVNDAFLDVLSFDGVLFRPGPMNGIQLLKERPFPAGLLLLWAPLYAETSADQTVGFTTGPFEAGQRGTTPTSTGYFVTVWHREGGAWRVAADIGVSTPIPYPVDSTARQVQTRSRLNRFKVDAMLYALDDSVSANYLARLRTVGASDLRLYRAGSAPSTTLAEAIASAQKTPAGEWKRAKLHVPPSGDLAYAFGTYKTADGEQGWLRIYRRTNMAIWKLIVDIT